MSMSLFANRKLAFGFAGAVVVLAVFAPYAVGMLVPLDQSEPETSNEAVAPVAAEAPAEPQPSWSDEPLADDWNTDTVSQANGFSGWAAKDSSDDEVDEVFGDFAPRYGGSGSGPSAPSAPSNSKSGQGKITSRAAPGAPAIAPPGGTTPGVLERAD